MSPYLNKPLRTLAQFKAEQAQKPPAVPFVDTCIEHGPGGTIRLSFQIRVF